MNANLLSLVQQALGSDFAGLASGFLGESAGSTQSAMSSLLPAVLGAVANKGATPGGAAGLLSLINGANLDTGTLGNVAGLFGAGGSGINSLLKLGTNSLVPALFGDKSSALVNALSSASGMKTASSTSLIAMVVSLVFTFLKKFVGDKGLNANSLASLLSAQGPNLQGALDGRLTSALGFASPAGFLSGLGSQAADAARGAGAALASGAGTAAAAASATAVTAKSGLMRWLPWLIGLVVLWFLWNMFSGKSTPAPSTPAVSTAPAPAPAAAPMAVVLPAKVYFEVGSSALGDEGSKTIAAVADMARKDGAKRTLTGYTDKTGDTAKNEELAKARAAAVRAALTSAGVAEADIEMRAPMFVEVGAGTSDAEARRVDIGKP